MIRCPECGTEVQATWDWCHACGWDPEALRPAGVAAPPPPTSGAPAQQGSDVGGRPRGPYAGPGHAPLPPQPARRGGGSTGRTVVLVLLGAGAAFVALTIVLILAVTFLGSSEGTSKFASVDGAVGLGGGADPIETTTTTVPIDTDLSAATWARYTAPDGSFSIELPVPDPTVDDTPSTDPGIVVNTTITAELAYTVYVLNYVELSPDYEFPDPNEVMKLEIDAMGEAFEIAYSSETPDTFGMLRARSFTGSMENGEGTVQGITFVAGQRAYFLMTVAFDRVLVDHDRFVDSFSVG